VIREIVEDYKSHKRALISQGFWALAIHRYGTAARSIRFAPLRFPFVVLHVILTKLSEIFFGIYIGANAKIGSHCVIEHFGSIIIHAEATLGNSVRLRQGVTIGNKSAEMPLAVPVIGNRVDIGAGAKILGPIVIGDDAVIGANAVVIRDVPAGALAVGVPARIITRNKVQDDSSRETCEAEEVAALRA
jgi:serine O-acetyltransferase